MNVAEFFVFILMLLYVRNLNWRSAMEVNYVKLAAANQQLELYANTGKPLNKAAALYIVSYINCVLKSTVRTDPESFSVQGEPT